MLSIDHKHRLKLVRRNGITGSHHKHGGTLIFRCTLCQLEMVFKRRKIHQLISGVKYKTYGHHMRCS